MRLESLINPQAQRSHSLHKDESCSNRIGIRSPKSAREIVAEEETA